MPLPDPVFLLVPHRHFTGSNSGSVFSQLPTNGTGDFIFTRSTIGSYVNSSGFITTSSIHEPRIKHFYTGSNDRSGFLIEPSATNFADNVEFLTNNDYALGGLTITTGSTDFLAPDGTSRSITKYVGGTASGSTQYAYYLAGNLITVTAPGVHTFSIFVKAGATNPLNFCMLDVSNFSGSSGTTNSYFSLASGTALTAGASIQNYGNGWYRLIAAPITIAPGDLTGNMAFAFAEGNNDINWPLSGALNLTAYTWGAQMETGPVATSYIPTTTTSVTRNADVLTDTSYTLPTPSGSIYTEFNALSEYSCFVNLAGPVPITTGSNRIAITYTNSNISVYKNGAFVVSQSAPNTIGGNIINLGHSSGSFQLNDTLRGFAIYNTPLSAPDAILLTSGSNRRYL